MKILTPSVMISNTYFTVTNTRLNSGIFDKFFIQNQFSAVASCDDIGIKRCGIFLRIFWSSIIWASQIWLSLTEVKTSKNPVIQPYNDG